MTLICEWHQVYLSLRYNFVCSSYRIYQDQLIKLLNLLGGFSNCKDQYRSWFGKLQECYPRWLPLDLWSDVRYEPSRVREAGPNILHAEQLRHICRSTLAVTAESFKRRAEAAKGRPSHPTHDEADVETAILIRPNRLPRIQWRMIIGWSRYSTIIYLMTSCVLMALSSLEKKSRLETWQLQWTVVWSARMVTSTKTTRKMSRRCLQPRRSPQFFGPLRGGFFGLTEKNCTCQWYQ